MRPRKTTPTSTAMRPLYIYNVLHSLVCRWCTPRYLRHRSPRMPSIHIHYAHLATLMYGPPPACPISFLPFPPPSPSKPPPRLAPGSTSPTVSPFHHLPHHDRHNPRLLHHHLRCFCSCSLLLSVPTRRGLVCSRASSPASYATCCVSYNLMLAFLLHGLLLASIASPFPGE